MWRDRRAETKERNKVARVKWRREKQPTDAPNKLTSGRGTRSLLSDDTVGGWPGAFTAHGHTAHTGHSVRPNTKVDAS